MNKKTIRILLFLSFCIPALAEQPFYFCTAADDGYYANLKNLIGSIHYYNYDQTGEIAIFDIGLTPDQRRELSSFAKVAVYDVEMTHPDLLTRFSARGGKRNVPGWYAWKPVVIKQALDMFPAVLYLDAGLTLKKSVEDIFKKIFDDGYCVIHTTRSIKWMATDYVMNVFRLKTKEGKKLAEKMGILAGIVGVARDRRYEDFILPLYELSKNLRNFAEDGTTRTARHDQPLFSLYAHRLGLKITPPVDEWIDLFARWNADALAMHEHIKVRE